LQTSHSIALRAFEVAGKGAFLGAPVLAFAGAKQGAEKGLFGSEMPETHTSGAEAHIHLIGFKPGINPRPTARTSFSAACKARHQFSWPYRHD
jgi:hypothetical protein